MPSLTPAHHVLPQGEATTVASCIPAFHADSCGLTGRGQRGNGSRGEGVRAGAEKKTWCNLDMEKGWPWRQSQGWYQE